MTLVTTLPARERLNNNLVTFFKQSLKDLQINDASQGRKIEHDYVELIPENNIISVEALQVVPADRIILQNRYFITFKLKDQFVKHFVLLRGLLEFSRPKGIKVFADTLGKTFRVEISEVQAHHFASYIQTILGWLVKEIKFKETLRDLIAFEERVKSEQAILYSNVRASLR